MKRKKKFFFIPLPPSEAEKNSPSESYFLLLLLEYALGDTYRRSLCSKNLKNQARERVRARFSIFFRIDESEQCGTQNSVQHCRVACTVTRTAVVGGKRHLRFGFVSTQKRVQHLALWLFWFCVYGHWLLSPSPHGHLASDRSG